MFPSVRTIIIPSLIPTEIDYHATWIFHIGIGHYDDYNEAMQIYHNFDKDYSSRENCMALELIVLFKNERAEHIVLVYPGAE